MRSESTSSSPEQGQSSGRLRRDVLWAAGSALVASAVVLQLDLGERFHDHAQSHERIHFDEIPFVAMVITLAALWVTLRAWNAARSENRRRAEVERRLRETELRERLVLEHLSTLVFEWTRVGDRGRLRYMGRDFEDWGTLEHEHELSDIGTEAGPALALGLGRRAEVGLQLRAALASADRFEIEYALDDEDEHWRRLEAVVVERDDAGELRQFIGIETNISDRVELARERAAADASRARSDVARGLVHDLGNLLMALDVYTQALDPADESTQGITSVRERARGLVSALAELGREAPLPTSEVDVPATLAPLVAAFQSRLPDSIGIEFDSPDEPPPVLGSVQAVERIVQNLLENAAQALESEEGTITVRVRAVSARLRGTRIAISDTGRGMEPRELERAREVFYTTWSTGSGLGLAVVEHLVRELAGELRIESKLGHGTTVEIDLPGCR